VGKERRQSSEILLIHIKGSWGRGKEQGSFARRNSRFLDSGGQRIRAGACFIRLHKYFWEEKRKKEKEGETLATDEYKKGGEIGKLQQRRTMGYKGNQVVVLWPRLLTEKKGPSQGFES